MRPDALDKPDPAIGDPTQLYHFTAIAYESAMLGQFMILLRPAQLGLCERWFPEDHGHEHRLQPRRRELAAFPATAVRRRVSASGHLEPRLHP